MKKNKANNAITPNHKSWKIWAKLSVSLVLLYFVLSQLELSKLETAFLDIDLPMVLAALILLNLAQIISALRLRFYMSTFTKKISRILSLKLYYIGMYFNMLLPGGIGGDGYIAWKIHKRRNILLANSIRILISSRLNGLLLLYIFVMLLITPAMSLLPLKKGLWALAWIVILLVGVVTYSLVARFLLKEKVRTQFIASLYSFFVQGLTLWVAGILFLSLNKAYSNEAIWAWDMYIHMVLFLISSIVAVLPISIGGVGLREIVFFYGIKLMGGDPATGIALSLSFFILNLISAVPGLFLWLKHTEQEELALQEDINDDNSPL